MSLIVRQEAKPPFIPEGAHAMTIVIEYPPGDPGTPPHRHPGPAFGYVLEGEMVFELEGEDGNNRGRGLPEALAGAEVVVNLTNSPTFDEASPAFFRKTMDNLLEAAGVGQAVILSIVGAELVRTGRHRGL
ncbi:cupin domain-containing protein [Amycolatopsis sp. NPDC051045]|uniref:cupin domain-containing protein n=1 Tax=Amycolatopsis sp. NPDC051045 TaxID=3156922 RepID=UPI003437D861